MTIFERNGIVAVYQGGRYGVRQGDTLRTAANRQDAIATVKRLVSASTEIQPWDWKPIR